MKGITINVCVFLKIVVSLRFFVQQRIASAVKRVEFVSDRMSYTVLSGR